MFTGLTLLIELAGLCISNTINLPFGDDVAVVLITWCSIAFFIDILIWRKSTWFKTSLLAAYAIRIVMIALLANGNVPFLSSSDADAFWSATLLKASGSGSTVYGTLFTTLMGRLTQIIGVNRLFEQYLLMLVSIGSILVLTKTLKCIGVCDKARNITVTIVCLLPSFALTSSDFIRESLICFCVTTSLSFFIDWMLNSGISNIVLAFTMCLLASAFHSGTIAVAIGYIICLMVYDQKKKAFTTNAFNIILALIIGGILLVLYTNYSDVLFFKMTKVESIEDVAITYGGNASYAQYVGDSNTLTRFIMYTPLRMLYFIASPIPWHWRGIADAVGFCFDAIYYIVSVLFMLPSLSRRRTYISDRRSLAIGVMIIILVVTLVFGWGCSNSAQAMRHRCKSIAVFSIAFAIGLDNLMQRKLKAMDN